MRDRQSHQRIIEIRVGQTEFRRQRGVAVQVASASADHPKRCSARPIRVGHRCIAALHRYGLDVEYSENEYGGLPVE
jgi:hypothetical protein